MESAGVAMEPKSTVEVKGSEAECADQARSTRSRTRTTSTKSTPTSTSRTRSRKLAPGGRAGVTTVAGPALGSSGDAPMPTVRKASELGQNHSYASRDGHRSRGGQPGLRRCQDRGQTHGCARRRRHRNLCRSSRWSTASSASTARLAELIDWHQPAAMAIEDLYFGKNVHSAMDVGQASGVAMLAAAQRGVDCFAYTPQAIKMAVCGSGAAGKGRCRRWSAPCSACPSCRRPTTPPTRSRWRSATAVRTGRREAARWPPKKRPRRSGWRDDRRGPRRGDGAARPITS